MRWTIRSIGVFFVSASLIFLSAMPPVFAGDGATEALELRWHAEMAIARERSEGREVLADVMQQSLSRLLLEHVATHDESIALDVVDAAMVRQHQQLARLIDQPGLAWALDVFAGEGTGHEQQIRTAMAGLADYHAVHQRQATEAAVKVYERTVERSFDRALDRSMEQLEKLDRIEERRLKAETQRNEIALARVADRADRASLKAAEHLAEKVVEKTEQVTEKLQKEAEKQVEKVEKEAEKQVEKVEKEVEKEAEKEQPIEPDPQPKQDQDDKEGKKDNKPKGGK